MTLVILGTQDKVFPRLLESIEKQIGLRNLKGEVIVQAGHTKFQSQTMKVLDFIPMDQFDQLLKKSDLIITHGGAGTILSGLKHDKKIIAVPRLYEYGEHENNHQLEIIEEFARLGYIIPCFNLDKLDIALSKVNEFHPKKYVSNNDKMVKLIEDYIDHL